MATPPETSDQQILDILRRDQRATVAELAESMGVTGTAVRQRLNRLLAGGLVERSAHRAGRGRPVHHYQLTDKGQRTAGTNYHDLALALWHELRSISEPEVRRRLLARIVSTLSEGYGQQITGTTLAQRMQSLAELMGEREVPFTVDASSGLPVLTALACPYPELAEQDRGICAMEKMLFSEVLGQGVRLGNCRLDGASCCTFEATGS